MNYQFGTASERAKVIEGLRKPETTFPNDWDAKRTQQRQSTYCSPYSMGYLTSVSLK